MLGDGHPEHLLQRPHVLDGAALAGGAACVDGGGVQQPRGQPPERPGGILDGQRAVGGEALDLLGDGGLHPAAQGDDGLVDRPAGEVRREPLDAPVDQLAGPLDLCGGGRRHVLAHGGQVDEPHPGQLAHRRLDVPVEREVHDHEIGAGGPGVQRRRHGRDVEHGRAGAPAGDDEVGVRDGADEVGDLRGAVPLGEVGSAPGGRPHGDVVHAAGAEGRERHPDHGHVDALLTAAGSGVATFGLPGSAGVTAATAAQTVVVPYNDVAAVREVFATRGEEVAAVITEAAPANMGVVPPDPGFNAFLREVTRQHGALLVVDEVLTGFRVGAAGWWGLEEEAAGATVGAPAWAPDLVTFGKVVGGGMPLAAVAGRADIMDRLSPTGPVYQAGTLSGNPLATAAGLATLRLADAEVYRRVDEVAGVVADAVGAALTREGVPHRVQRAGSLFSVFFGEAAAAAPVRSYDQVTAQDAYRYPPFFHAMLDAGVALPPSVFEAWFLSAAHDDAAVERVLTALPAAARAAASARPE